MTTENPYQAPQAELVASVAGARPLYSIGAVGIATFIGSPLAGALLLTRNLAALGRSSESGGIWGLAVAVFVALTALALILPESVPALPFTIAQLMWMTWLTQQRVGEQIRVHREQAGIFHSNWKAAGIGLLFGVVIFAIAFAVVLLLGLLGVL